MKKIIAAFLALALLTPSFAFAIDEILPTSASRPGSGTTQDVLANTGPNASASIASITASGEIVGCHTGGFGGALAQTFGAALQQAIPGFIRSQLQGPLSKLASQAGPFGGLINSVANMALNKLSTFIQNKIGEVLGGLGGGTVGQALSAVTGGAGVGPSVPVDPITVKPEIQRTDKQTKATQDATETSAQKDCVGDVALNKLKNLLLSTFIRTTIDVANNGFNGDGAIIQNLFTFAKTGLNALTQDFIQNATSGICAKDQEAVQVILLQQYQYEESYAVQSQCTDETAGGESDDGSGESLYNAVFHDQNTGLGALMLAKSNLNEQQANSALNSILTYVVGDGVRPSIICEDGSAQQGTYCKGGLGKGEVVLTGDMAGHVIKKAITTPIDQVLNADEIGELVDAFTAGLTQFIFQGIDGLAGASQKSSGGASYLDAMVDASAGAATTGTQRLIGRDIAAAAEVEQEYFDTVSTALVGVQQIKSGYAIAIACYQLKVNSSNSALALQKIQNASSTIATILNPQITVLTTSKQKSQSALNEYDVLIARAETVENQDDILHVHAEFTALISSGRVHTAVDLASLQNNLQSASASLSILSTDSVAQLTECQAL